MKFSDLNIVVIGDVMLDKYIFGNVGRISPEAPVAIVQVKDEKYIPGGAANAAHNIVTLSGTTHLFGIVGDDIAKEIFLDVTKKNLIDTDGIISDATRQTIRKIRVVGHSQQLLRIDYEDKEYLQNSIIETMIDKLKNIKKIDAIIISDYAKGVISKEFMNEIKKIANKQIPIIVDPKPKHKNFYKNVTLLTPNKKEAEEMSGIEIENEEDLLKAGNKLMNDLNCDILITTGEKGMSLFERKKDPIHIPTVAKEVYDVSGAGDTVIATMSLALAAGKSLEESAVLANHAAGIKVGKLGTAPVKIEELEKSLENE